MSQNALARTKRTIAAEKQDADTKRYLDLAFLARVAKGEDAYRKMQAEEAKAKQAAQKFPFQRRTLGLSHSFQPQLSTPSYGAHSSGGW
jgi:hypothetical protein